MGRPVPYTEQYDKLWRRDDSFYGQTQFLTPVILKVTDGGGVVKRPNWKKLPKIIRDEPLAYHKEWHRDFRGLRNWQYSEDGPSGYHYHQRITGPVTTSLFPTNVIEGVLETADYKAKAKLFEQLKGEGANIANMFAERKQTVRGIENVLNTLVYTARDLRRGNLTSAIRRMGGDPLTARKLRATDISQQWLALQYGWKPLLGDVFDLVTQQHKRETTYPRCFRVKGKQTEQAPNNASWTADPHYGKKYGIRFTSVSVNYMIRAYPNNALAEPAALGLTNPLVPLWEVVPWSFVVDWFLPVGAYLEQLTAAHGWSFHDGCRSTLTRCGQVAQYNLVTSYISSGNAVSSNRQLNASSDYVAFRRELLNTFPSASLPRFKNPLSIGHVLNSIALLAGLTNHHDHAGWRTDRNFR